MNWTYALAAIIVLSMTIVAVAVPVTAHHAVRVLHEPAVWGSAAPGEDYRVDALVASECTGLRFDQCENVRVKLFYLVADGEEVLHTWAPGAYPSDLVTFWIPGSDVGQGPEPDKLQYRIEASQKGCAGPLFPLGSCGLLHSASAYSPGPGEADWHEVEVDHVGDPDTGAHPRVDVQGDAM